MAAKGFVRVAPDSTGKKVANAEVTQGADTVEIQLVGLADSDDDGLVLRVVAAVGGLIVSPTLPLRMEYEVVNGTSRLTFPNYGYDTLRISSDIG